MSDPASAPEKTFTVQLPQRSLKIAGIAFGVGVLLFGVVWLAGRKDNDFYRADASKAGQPATELAPLPEPLPAGAGASQMPAARPDDAAPPPTLVEAPPPPPPEVAAPAPTIAVEPGTPAPAAPAGPADRPQPLPDQSPAPDYPPEALRAGETGTVVVQVQVDAAGNPTDARVIQRSGSRALDRAALSTVRRWRFAPAMSQGQAVPGTLEIPFDFQTEGH